MLMFLFTTLALVASATADLNVLPKSENRGPYRLDKQETRPPLKDFIVSIKDELHQDQMHELIDFIQKKNADKSEHDFSAPVGKIFEDSKIFHLKEPTAKAVEEIKNHAHVLEVERDQYVYATGMEPSNLRGAAVKTLDFCDDNLYQWGLDRIDQRSNTLSCTNYDPVENTNDGDKTFVFVLDTGIQADHGAFEGNADRTVRIFKNYYPPNNLPQNNDADGHGTHVASTIAGKLVGVAETADIFSMKVLDDDGSGTLSIIQEAMETVMKFKKVKANARTVVNMSLGGGKSTSTNRVANDLARSGVMTVVAAGNEAQDACNVSPASATDVITVGAAKENGNFDTSYSNFGSCVDIIAPGTDILGACSDLSNRQCTGGNFYVSLSGTSMASPHVAGVAALYLAQRKITASPSPEMAKAVLQCTASVDKLGRVPAGTVNLMAFNPLETFDQEAIDCIRAAIAN